MTTNWTYSEEERAYIRMLPDGGRASVFQHVDGEGEKGYMGELLIPSADVGMEFGTVIDGDWDLTAQAAMARADELIARHLAEAQQKAAEPGQPSSGRADYIKRNAQIKTTDLRRFECRIFSERQWIEVGSLAQISIKYQTVSSMHEALVEIDALIAFLQTAKAEIEKRLNTAE